MARAITHTGDVVEVEDDVMGVVNEIHSRWPDLKVQYLDPDRFPELTDSPYIIVDQAGRRVMGVWQLDRRVIEHLALRDKSQKEMLALFDKEALKVETAKAKAKTEKHDEIKDVMNHVFKSPKGKYSFKNEEGEVVEVSDG